MKWVFYVIVFVYMFYRAVYGLKASDKAVILGDNADYEDEIAIEAGEGQLIPCNAPGKNQKIKWFNPKGQEIPRIQSKRVHGQYQVQSPYDKTTSLLLNITKAEVRDSGVWVCRAGQFKYSVSLCVIDPTDFEGTPVEVAADEGRSYTLSCLTRGTPDAIISWSRDGQLITDNDDEDTPKYKVMTKFNSPGIEGLLTIISLNTDDSGVYTCEATQQTKLAEKCKRVQSFNITLNIKHAPFFGEKKKENVYGVEHETLYLRCEADSYPEPSYQWIIKSDGGEITKVGDNEIIKADNGSASVLPVKVTEDSFDYEYVCQASNQLGKDEYIFNILRPAKPERPYKVEELENMSSSKSLAFNVTWNNEIAFEISSIEVQIIPTVLRIRTATPNDKDFKRVTPYEVPIGEVLENSITATAMGLQPSTEYWVRLRVKNEVGDSPWSDPIKVTTKNGEDDDEEEVKSQEEDEEQTKENMDSETTEAESATEESTKTTAPNLNQYTAPDDSGRFYGLFFAVGVFIVAIGCTFVARMI